MNIPRELVRILIAWVVISVIGVLLVWFVLGPHLPTGTMSDVASGQSEDNRVMATLVTPVVILLVLYFVYCLTQFRHRGAALQDGLVLRGDGRTMGVWIGATTVIVLFLAAWGTYELFPGQQREAHEVWDDSLDEVVELARLPLQRLVAAVRPDASAPEVGL